MPYVNIKIEQVRELLKAEKGWVETVESGKEHVFTYTLKKSPNVVIKVWSSVHDMQTMTLGDYCAASAKRGGDSIKVCAVDTVANKGLRKTPRIHRSGDWQKRIKDRVIELLKDLGDIS